MDSVRARVRSSLRALFRDSVSDCVRSHCVRSIVMTGGMEHFDEMGHGALWRQGSWSIVMTGVMAHCDDWGHGAL